MQVLLCSRVATSRNNGRRNRNYNGTPDDSTSDSEVKRSSIVIRGNNH